jgi:hypothetical protein
MKSTLAAFAVLIATLAMPWQADAAQDTRPCVSRSEAKALLESDQYPLQRRLETRLEVTGLGVQYDAWTTSTETAYWYPTCSTRNDLAVSYDRTTGRLTFMAWGFIPPGSPLVSSSAYYGSQLR